MRASRAKQLLGLILAAGAVASIVAALVVAGLSVIHTGTGADPASAFSTPQIVPENLGDLVVWQAADSELARQVEPATQLLVEAAWVRSWQEVDRTLRGSADEVEARFMPGLADRVGEGNTASEPAAVVQHGHSLQPTFYSLDGSIMALEISSDLERAFLQGPALRSADRFEVVMVLSDGKWRVLRLTRLETEAIPDRDGPVGLPDSG